MRNAVESLNGRSAFLHTASQASDEVSDVAAGRVECATRSETWREWGTSEPATDLRIGLHKHKRETVVNHAKRG
jgi:hypothetical protein